MTLQDRGAEIQARPSKPSVDLATLVELLTKAIAIENDIAESADPRCIPAFLFDNQKQRLKLCTSAVLRRLFRQPGFRRAFDPVDGNGFVRDLPPPAYGTHSRIGGCLSDHNSIKLPAAIDQLMTVINQSIDAALPTGLTLISLLLEQPDQQLKQLAQQVGVPFKHQANTANLIPLAFKAEEAVTHQDTAVAKVISAIERIDANDYFDRMYSAVSDFLLHQRDYDEEEIETALESLVEEQQRSDSQINRFLKFIDDEALSRVRMTIVFQIMETIADNARTVNQPGYQLLIEYIHRVICLVETTKKTGYTIDLTAHYGVAAEFELLEYLSRATFYTCLPVWAEWQSQIFEEKVKNQTSTSYAVVREVSYRFKINGQNPKVKKSAFAARLDEIETELVGTEVPAKENTGRVSRRLAELIFLSIVIPQPDQESLTEATLSQSLQQLLLELRSGGKPTIANLLQDLRERASTMETIATALISVLRTKSQKVMTQVQRRSSQQFICVKRGIIQWSRLEGAESGVQELLIGSSQRSREQVEWFKHIEILDKPDAPGLLFSVKVNTEIAEYSLIVKEAAQQIQIQRLLPAQLLQICWVPYHAEKINQQWTYKVAETAKEASGWILPASIHVEYDVETLRRCTDRKNQADKNKQFHAAAIAAFAVLVYCCLWCIIQRLKATGEPHQLEFTTLMLRLQETGKSADIGSGDSYVYAAAQAIEALLAQDTPIRMQGVVLNNLIRHNQSARYVKAGTFDALLSAFPIVISTPVPPAVPQIGLISYATRPCDELSSFSSDKIHLLLTQSYVASAVQHPFQGYKLNSERRQSDVIDSSEQLKKQRLIQEEIGYLKAQGCQHIILLSHAYGTRRLNRTADGNSPLIPKEFLEDVSQTFPDLTIYTLLRDVFPATRLRRRSQNQAAFEILRVGDHTSFLQAIEMVRVRDVIPVYTFATLYVIEEEKRPQSGFCAYFLVSDQRLSNFDWTERPRRHLVNADRQSEIHPCLISVLRGLHFIEAERGVKQGQLIPVLDPFSWISPTTIEAAGEVEILHTRRKGKVLLSYPALLTQVARVLHRRR